MNCISIEFICYLWIFGRSDDVNGNMYWLRSWSNGWIVFAHMRDRHLSHGETNYDEANNRIHQNIDFALHFRVQWNHICCCIRWHRPQHLSMYTHCTHAETNIDHFILRFSSTTHLVITHASVMWITTWNIIMRCLTSPMPHLGLSWFFSFDFWIRRGAEPTWSVARVKANNVSSDFSYRVTHSDSSEWIPRQWWRRNSFVIYYTHSTFE